ncbi:flagellar associated protein, partial [Haematococcus lacustris]
MPPQQAQALLEYLKANPEAAKEAQQVLKNPGMAQAFMNMQGAAQQPGMADKYQALKDDPDLKHVFDDVVKNGPSAFQKYWDDVDLMAKISAKMRALQVEPSSTPPRPNSGRAPGSAAPLTSLHDAAKAGDEAAVIRLLDAGEKVDGK